MNELGHSCAAMVHFDGKSNEGRALWSEVVTALAEGALPVRRFRDFPPCPVNKALIKSYL
jgi:hypothetical protein